MQRKISSLESRHRLFHLRASLERIWSQSKRHPKYIGPSLNSKLRLFQKKKRLHGHRIGKKLQNKATIILPITWEKMHQKEFSRDPRSLVERSWISCISTRTWSKWRGLYPDGRSYAKKISPIIWRKQNTFDTQRIGGSLNNPCKIGPLRIRSDINDALTTWTIYTKNLENNNSGQCHSGKYQRWHQSWISSSSCWQWSDSWWSLHNNSKKLHTSSRAKQHDRTGGPVVCSLFTKLRRVDFQEFLKICSEIAYSWRQSAATERGVWTPPTSHDHFCSVNLYKEVSYRLKMNKFSSLKASELVSRHTERQAQQCVWNDLKHLANLWA